jgi:SH3 domain-containing YSC84-like protein 1
MGVLNKSKGVVVLPSVKDVGAGQNARGVMTCRGGENLNGPWSAPTMMQSSVGSLGLQAGGQATDFVFLAMNDKGAHALMNGKEKLGADANVTAGPTGSGAEAAATNAALTAEIFAYSRTQGAFTGISPSGTSVGPDEDANKELYGKKVTATEILDGSTVQSPDSARELLAVLTEKSPGNVAKK